MLCVCNSLSFSFKARVLNRFERGADRPLEKREYFMFYKGGREISNRTLHISAR